jgi:hypothetical protein
MYLDFERLRAVDPVAFQTQEPFPWINPARLLTEEGYCRLLETLPKVAHFKKKFGGKRNYGQQPHDRLSLDYHDGLEVAKPWKEFVKELRGEVYRSFIAQLIASNDFEFRLHWHYTPRGCSVSPHCDNISKLGSHIFYFNTVEDWDPDWGGETLILDDGGRFDHKSAPGFEDFERIISSKALGNYSLLFCRKGNSWHGVRELRCPEGSLRKVFIVAIHRLHQPVELSKQSPVNRLQRFIRKLVSNDSL